MVNGTPLIQGTSQENPVLDILNEPSQAQLSCEAKGGRWDEANQRCILPDTTPPPKLKPEQEESLRSKQTKAQGQTFNIGGKEVSRDEYVRIKSQLGFEGGSEGLTVTEQDKEIARQINLGKEGLAIEQERERLIAEETPQRRDLDPETGFLEGVPGIGGSVGVGRRLIGTPLKKALGLGTNQDLELTPEVLRTAALTEIERQEVERGLTDNEKFGEFVESLPFFGSLANQFAGGLIETPSENAKQVKSNILKERRRITNIETNVKLGYLPVSVAREQIKDIEENVQRLESRIRLLVNHSPELRFNSDYVNTVETEILATREKAFQAKQNILTGATKDPDELQLLQQMQLYSSGDTE